MTKKKTITKRKIVSVIYKRYGKALKTSIIKDAVSIICAKLEEDLLQDRAVSIDNFGTFSPCVIRSHRGLNVVTGKMQVVAPFRDVKFHPHAAFVRLLELRRDSFLVEARLTKTPRPSKKI